MRRKILRKIVKILGGGVLYTHYNGTPLLRRLLENLLSARRAVYGRAEVRY